MNELFAAIKAAAEFLGVEPAFYPVVIAFGIGHQYLKGMLKGWTSTLSVLSAGALAVVFGGLSWWQLKSPPFTGAVAIISLFSLCLIVEGIVGLAAEKVPFIPKNNEWTNKEKPSA